MPTKPVFNLRAGDKIIATKYDRLLYTRGTRAHIFALHREHSKTTRKEWIVSDPVSGYRLLRVNAAYKGLPVSSADLTLAQAEFLDFFLPSTARSHIHQSSQIASKTCILAYMT